MDPDHPTTCPICSDILADGSDVQALMCGHPYHSYCINRYCSHAEKSLETVACPVCKETAESMRDRDGGVEQPPRPTQVQTDLGRFMTSGSIWAGSPETISGPAPSRMDESPATTSDEGQSGPRGWQLVAPLAARAAEARAAESSAPPPEAPEPVATAMPPSPEPAEPVAAATPKAVPKGNVATASPPKGKAKGKAKAKGDAATKAPVTTAAPTPKAKAKGKAKAAAPTPPPKAPEPVTTATPPPPKAPEPVATATPPPPKAPEPVATATPPPKAAPKGKAKAAPKGKAKAEPKDNVAAAPPPKAKAKGKGKGAAPTPPPRAPEPVATAMPPPPKAPAPVATTMPPPPKAPEPVATCAPFRIGDTSVFCSLCCQEVHYTKARMTSKVQCTWKCDRCNATMVQCSRGLGSWNFEAVPEEDKIEFYRQAKDMGQTKTAGMARPATTL